MYVKLHDTQALPSGLTAGEGIQRISKGKRDGYCKVLDEVLMIEVGIKCDILKN